MGGVAKLIDALLFLYFTMIAVAVPVVDAQICLPLDLYFPQFLVDFKLWYTREYGHYLVVEKPNFYMGLVWLVLLSHWPLSLANLYGLLAATSWLPTTCLIYGVSSVTTMVAVLGELMGSHKAPDKLVMMYFTFLGFSSLAILRGLLSHSGKTTAAGRTLGLNKKKRV